MLNLPRCGEDDTSDTVTVRENLPLRWASYSSNGLTSEFRQTNQRRAAETRTQHGHFANHAMERLWNGQSEPASPMPVVRFICLARLTGLAGHARGATGQTVQGLLEYSSRDGFFVDREVE